jgi:hypothetical protein
MSVEPTQKNRRAERRFEQWAARGRRLAAEETRAAGRRVLAAGVAVFLPAVAWLLGFGAWAGPAFGLGVALFVAAVLEHEAVRRRQRRLEARRKLDERLEAHREVRWEAIPPLPEIADLPAPVYRDDLALVRGKSLLRLLHLTATDAGLRALARRLDSNAVDATTALLRQDETRFLAARPVFRRRFLVTALTQLDPIPTDRLRRTLEGGGDDAVARRWFPRLVLLQAALGVCLVAGYWGRQSWAPWAFLPLFGAVMLAYRAATRDLSILESFGIGLELDTAIGKLRDLLDVAWRWARPGRDGRVPASFEAFRGDRSPSSALRELERVLGALGVRQNYLVHVALNAFFPWDCYWTLRLARVRRRLSALVPKWLDGLAELEAAIALAEFAAARRDDAGWSFPSVDGSGAGAALDGQGLAHPLLGREAVGNDVRLDERVRAWLLTGSNMAGKSTLLRTVGTNLLLAKAGTVVRASRLVFRPLPIWSSIAVGDSLDDGLSLFYAEVRRLKAILDAARTGGSSHPVLFLVDELFRGTNNRERLAGSRAYIPALLASGSFGLVTTHDLELAELAGAVEALENRHLRESFRDGKMCFSYRLETGPCPSTNALYVMREAGLPTP